MPKISLDIDGDGPLSRFNYCLIIFVGICVCSFETKRDKIYSTAKIKYKAIKTQI